MTLLDAPSPPEEFIDNRRRHPRTKFEGPVLLDSTSAWCQGRGIDVSAGGMRLKSERPLPLGATVDVYFELGALSIETKAKVVRRRGSLVCLAFDKRHHHAHPTRQWWSSSNKTLS